MKLPTRNFLIFCHFYSHPFIILIGILNHIELHVCVCECLSLSLQFNRISPRRGKSVESPTASTINLTNLNLSPSLSLCSNSNFTSSVAAPSFPRKMAGESFPRLTKKIFGSFPLSFISSSRLCVALKFVTKNYFTNANAGESYKNHGNRLSIPSLTTKLLEKSRVSCFVWVEREQNWKIFL